MKTTRFIRSVLTLSVLALSMLPQSCKKEDVDLPEDDAFNRQNGFNDLYLYDIGKQKNSKITDSPNTSEWGHIFSPDSKRIFFSQLDNSRSINLDGTDMKKFAEKWQSAVWSPDKNKIAYVIDATSLSVTDADGKKTESLINKNIASSPLWSKDSKSIAIFTREALIVTDLTGNTRNLEIDLDLSISSFSDWSQISNRIIYTKSDYRTPSNSQIVAYDMALEKEIVLVSETENMYSPRFNPVTDEILFAMENSSANSITINLMVMDFDGNNQRLLTPLSYGNNRGADWSPDGKEIVFETENGDIGIINKDGTNFRIINEIIGDCQDPIWSPDGTYILYNRYTDYTIN